MHPHHLLSREIADLEAEREGLFHADRLFQLWLCSIMLLKKQHVQIGKDREGRAKRAFRLTMNAFILPTGVRTQLELTTLGLLTGEHAENQS